MGIRGEAAGVLPPAESWSDLSRATIAFGQGLSVNAFQMTAALNTVANDGVRISPNVIRGSATTDSGQEVGTDHTTRSEEHTSELQSLMRISYAVFCLKKKKK